MIFIGFSPRLFAESIEAAMSDGFEDGYVNARSLTGAKRAEMRKAPPAASLAGGGTISLERL
jgi:hypothetical protein